MASSWVAVINSALIKIGETPILSVDDGSKEANLAKARYEEVRDVVLRMHPWNCAMARVSLAPLTTVPAFDFTAEFQLPSDCIRLISIDESIDYRIEGLKILADASELNIKYIQRVTDPNQLDVLCAEAVSLYLAWDLSYALKPNSQRTDYLLKVFQNHMRRAGSIDSQEDGRRVLSANWFFDSRTSTPETPGNR